MTSNDTTPPMNSISTNEYILERDGEVRGSYPFDDLVAMWKNKELRLTDRIQKKSQSHWTEVSKIVHALEKADRTSSGLVSRTNLVVGICCILIGLGMYLWARDYSPELRPGLIDPLIYNILLIVCALFGIVGLIKIFRGVQ